jgi:hypothetical protein
MQRRFFLKTCLSLPVRVLLLLMQDLFLNCFRVTAAKSFTGRVTSKGKPLANVMVTDSYSVVATDKNGMYTIDAHNDAQFITISTPSGYDFMHEDHISTAI